MSLPNCSICLEPFTQPVSLPCGHVFCKPCIRRAVESEPQASSSKQPCGGLQRSCPACRTPFSIITIDPALIPPHMRPHVQPSIRPLYLDASASAPSYASTSPAATSPSPPPAWLLPAPASPAEATAKAQAELAALRAACSLWKRRAEQHASANHGLLAFARAAKDCALRLRSERDCARTRCTLLKRTLAESLPHCQSDFHAGSGLGAGSGSDSDSGLSPSPAQDPNPGLDPAFLASIRTHLTTDSADVAADTAHAHAEVATRSGPGAGGLPVYLFQAHTRAAEMYYDNPADVEASHFGAPFKRKAFALAQPGPGPGPDRSRSKSPRFSPMGNAARASSVGVGRLISPARTTVPVLVPTVSLGAVADADEFP
ncbi:RING-type domain-containing protein [Mycena kentingensis (nom. inval.)]|nr:RING-type domain-containing protein [Mycena kentingensis (nom. inval.)]